jgi:hypothetical protein
MSMNKEIKSFISTLILLSILFLTHYHAFALTTEQKKNPEAAPCLWAMLLTGGRRLPTPGLLWLGVMIYANDLE